MEEPTIWKSLLWWCVLHTLMATAPARGMTFRVAADVVAGAGDDCGEWSKSNGDGGFSCTLPVCSSPPCPPTCISRVFSSQGKPYMVIRGLVSGKQKGFPAAFSATARTIDDVYIDGVSITTAEGQRQHIMSLAVGRGRIADVSTRCPCGGGTVPPPEFVGASYLCDTAVATTPGFNIWFGSPLWDGNNCEPVDQACCDQVTDGVHNFEKWLPRPTTADIEVRICSQVRHASVEFPEKQQTFLFLFHRTRNLLMLASQLCC